MARRVSSACSSRRRLRSLMKPFRSETRPAVYISRSWSGAVRLSTVQQHDLLHRAGGPALAFDLDAHLHDDVQRIADRAGLREPGPAADARADTDRLAQPRPFDARVDHQA